MSSAKPSLLLAMCILAAARSAANERSGPPSFGALAGALVRAPLNPESAAYSSDFLKGLGFSGAILDCPEGEFAASSSSIPLLKARSAAERLKRAGLVSNFFYLRGREEEFRTLADPARLVAKAAALAALSRQCGVQGLALDFRSLAPSGTDLSSIRFAGPDSREAGRNFGESLAAAIAEAYPSAETLLFVGDPLAMSSAGLGLVQGICEGLARSQGTTLHVIVCPGPGGVNPGALKKLAPRCRAMLRLHLSAPAVAWWDRNGKVGLGVEPEPVFGSGATSGTNPMSEWAVAARVLSEAYAVFFVPPPALAQAPRVSTPLDSFVRSGWLEASASGAAVLSGESGAALLFLEGSRAPLNLDARPLPVHVTDLRALKREAIPLPAAVSLGPFEGATLVEDLPVHEWAVPAALWLEPDAPLAQGDLSIPIRFGWTNPSQLTFTGVLEAAVPKGFSVQPRTHAVNLGPGDSLVVSGTLQGRAECTRNVEVRLILATPGAPSAIRKFMIPVAPSLLWESAPGGPIAAGPVAVYREEGDAAALLVSSGESVACMNGSGQVVWRTTPAQDAYAEPAALTDAGGRQCVLLLDGAGSLRCLDTNGREIWNVALGSPSVQRAPLAANLDASPGQEAVVGTANGRVLTRDSRGKSLWESRVDGAVTGLAALDINDDGRDEIIVLAQTLTAMDSEGGVIWALREAGVTPSCPLLVADLHGDWRWTLVAGASNGRILCLDPASGAVRAQVRVSGGPVLGLACADLLSTPGQEILAATGNGLFCLTNGLSLLWAKELTMGAAPEVAETGKETWILAPTRESGLLCIGPDGATIWSDIRTAGPLLATPLIVPDAKTGRPVAVYGSTDHFLRAIQIPE